MMATSTIAINGKVAAFPWLAGKVARKTANIEAAFQ